MTAKRIPARRPARRRRSARRPRPAQTPCSLTCSAAGSFPLPISQRLDFRRFAYNKGVRGFRFGRSKLRRCAHRKVGGSLFKGIDSRNLSLSRPKNGEDAGHPMPMGTSIYRGSLLVLNAVTRNANMLPRSSSRYNRKFFREKARLSASFCHFVLSANLRFLEHRERVGIIKLFRMKVQYIFPLHFILDAVKI